MIFFDAHLQLEDGGSGQQTPETLSVGPLNPDMISLEAHYRQQGEVVLGNFGKFLNIWESREFRRLMEPEASMAFVASETVSGLLKSFGTGEGGRNFIEAIESSRRAAMFAWTIGERIEACIFRHLQGKDRLIGFMMDAASTLMLNEMLCLLRDLITREAFSRFGLFPTAEYCPGIGGGGLAMIPDILKITGADRYLGLRTGKGMIKPIKSRCSIVLLGAESEARNLGNLPCVPCQGKKCLYFQLGGCHVNNMTRSVY